MSEAQHACTDGAAEDQHEPGQYAIRLMRHLDARWAERFDGLNLSYARQPSSQALWSIRLHHMACSGPCAVLSLPLLSVTCVEPGQANGMYVNSNTDNRRANR